MATNLDIIKRAMKKIHVLASGAEPTATQAADGMAALQSLIVELIGQGSLGRLNDVLATSNYTAREDDRIQASNGAVITLPTSVTDSLSPYPYIGGNWSALSDFVGFWDYGSFYSGTSRPPRDRTPVVVITANVPVSYVWTTYKNKWIVINTLTQQGDFPFADYLENGFAAMLAERLAEDYAQEIGPQTIKQAGACRLLLSCKFDSVSLPTAACYF